MLEKSDSLWMASRLCKEIQQNEAAGEPEVHLCMLERAVKSIGGGGLENSNYGKDAGGLLRVCRESAGLA